MSFCFGARRKRNAFTLVEMLVTLVLLSVLGALTGAVVIKARARTRALRCLANQQEITNALVAYYEDHATFPPDGTYVDLAISLSDYIGWPPQYHDTMVPGVYRCPNDRISPPGNSYQSYYVRRKEPGSSEYFVIGCPRHSDAEPTYLNTLGLRGGAWAKEGCVVINDEVVPAERPQAQRSMRGGRIQFEDKSSAIVISTSEDYRVTATASFRHEDGRLYTIVRVEGTGRTSFNVTPGSKFEVVTPVAIIGVRGTDFLVKTDEGYARIDVLSGTVHVWDRMTEREFLLHAGESTEIGPVPVDPNALCIHCKKHCKDGKHCDRCPLHVGRPEYIGTRYCVECSKHCDIGSISTKNHCSRFCPHAQENSGNTIIYWPEGHDY